MANEIPYIAEAASRSRFATAPIAEIAAAIGRDGFWEDEWEWRISTVTRYRIHPFSKDGERWFWVRVRCGTEMGCPSPTLERAVEYLGVFDRLVRDLMWTLGWPDWAAKGRLEPIPGETIPPSS